MNRNKIKIAPSSRSRVRAAWLFALAFAGFGFAQTAQIADGYWNKAKELQKQGKYPEAARMYEKSAEAEMQSPAPRMSDLATELYQAGYYYKHIGLHDKAAKYYQEALVIDRKLGREAEIAVDLNNLGQIHASWGRYEKAVRYYQQSLEIDRKLGREDEIATRLNSIGEAYASWGRYDKALQYYQQALEVDKKSGEGGDVAIDLSNIGRIYDCWGQYEKALQYYQQALEIGRKMGQQAGVAIRLNTIGALYYSWGRYEKALQYYQQALEIDRKLGREEKVAALLGNIGRVYDCWGQYEKALGCHQQALEIFKKQNNALYSAYCLNNIGALYHALKKDSLGIPFLLQSLALEERLCKTEWGEAAGDCLESRTAAYQLLLSSYLRRGNVLAAFDLCEISRVKLLAEQFPEGGLDSVPLTALRKTIPPQGAVLAYANTGWPNDKALLVLTPDVTRGIEVSDTAFTADVVKRYAALIAAVLPPEKEIAVVSKHKADGENVLTLSANSGRLSDLEKIIALYCSLISAPANAAVGTMKAAGIPSNAEERVRELSRGLYDLFIKPIAPELAGKTQLIIMPDGPLGCIPFETLIDDKGKYLGEKFLITYTPSLTVLDKISKRQYPADRKPLLALGNAIYGRFQGQADTISNGAQLAYLARKAEAAIAAGGSTRAFYASIGKAGWDSLPLTLAEVKAIAGVVKGAVVITGDSASENTVKAMSQNNDLAGYKALHFATHGIALREIPGLSGLVLSQFKEERGNEDGYVCMAEIAQLRLQADFVCLSACETGLGLIRDDKAVMGLAQAFLLAGANGLSMSLWQAADESTAKAMAELYKTAQANGGDYAGALTQVKRRFIKGEFGEKYKRPFYWAPFVYYGK